MADSVISMILLSPFLVFYEVKFDVILNSFVQYQPENVF